MNSIEKSVYLTVCLLMFMIGIFSGLIFEKDKRVQNISDNKKVKEMFVHSKDLIEFWEHGYMKRDSSLRKISNHRDCTFELKSIIGEIY